MATKTFALEAIGDIKVIKRQGNRHLRLSILPNGQVRVSIPTWAPYQAGIDFARAKQDWIDTKRPVRKPLSNGQIIGKTYKLSFVHDSVAAKPKSRLRGNCVEIICPEKMAISDESAQLAAHRAIIRALKKQASMLLPKRIDELGKQHGITFSQVKIKQMNCRWGSCDQKNNITFNLFLIQLPWQLIDYVILHELAHVNNLNHSAEFWRDLEQLAPNARQLKKRLNSYHPGII